METGDKFIIIGEKDGCLIVNVEDSELYINSDELDHTWNPQFDAVAFWS